MNKRDILIGLILGFVIGAFLIPTTKNIGVFSSIPFPYLVFLIGMPLLSAAGVFIAALIGRIVPIIWQIAKFGLVGGMNTVVDFGILNVFIFATGYDRGAPLALLKAVTFVLANSNSFFWNKKWVFADRAGNNDGKSEFFQFLVVSIISLLISSAIIGGMTGYITPIGGLSAKQWANAANAVSAVMSMVTNFVGYRFIVFRKKA